MTFDLLELQPIVEQVAIQATRAAMQESLSFLHSHPRSDLAVDTSMRLPKLNLPNFDCNILKWPEFWDVFESSVDKRLAIREEYFVVQLLWQFLGYPLKRELFGGCYYP